MPLSLAIAMWFSSLALPFWLCFWQICEAYLLWGERARSHYERPGVLISLSFLFFLSCSLLCVGMVAIVWYFLPSAALGLMVVSALVFLFGCWFIGQIGRAANGD